MSEPRSLEEARRIADEKRQTFTDATEALKSRVESDAEQVNALVERAKTTAEIVDDAVRRYRWVALAAAVTFGATLGRRGSRRRRIERMLTSGDERVVVQKPPRRRSLFGSLFSVVASAVVKDVALRVVDRLQKKDD